MSDNEKWTNENMWIEAVAWRKGGATYSEIGGKLSRPENMKRFGLVAVPSDESIRRYIKRRLLNEHPNKQSETAQAITDHIADMTWICEQLRIQVNMPVLQLFRSQEVDQASGRFWSAKGWTPDPESQFDVNWGVSIDRSYISPFISLVVEGFPAYEQLKQHLSTLPVLQYLSDWKNQIAAAVNIIVELNVELRSSMEPSVERWILPEELTTTTDGVLHSFTDSEVAAAFQHLMNIQVDPPRYIIEARPRHSPDKHVYELSWQGVTNLFIVLAVSSNQKKLDELQSLHQDTVNMLKGRNELVLITRANEQAMNYRRHIGDSLDSVLHQTRFPGNCAVCRNNF